MADPFSQAGEYFSGVFNEQGRAARRQVMRDRPGLENDLYGPQIETASTVGAVPPEIATSAPVGENDFNVSPVETESVKDELIQMAKSRRNGSSGDVSIRAGGGYNPAVKQVT
jgi:hypothetical protein